MKVLHVIDAMGLGGGAEHSLATMLPLLRDRGVESSVACLIPRVGGLQADVGAAGFPIEVLGARTWPGHVRALRHKVRTERPDIVHATLVKSCLLSRVAGIRAQPRLLNSLVNTSYDPVRAEEMKIARWKLRVMREVDGFTARHLVDEFHAITEAVADEAVEVLGVDRARIRVIPRGRSVVATGDADPERRHRIRQELGIDDDVAVVVNVGRQDLQKAQPGLVRAFARVVATRPDALLLIAGRDGAATPELQATIEREGVSDSVRLLGHRTDVLDIVAGADLFAFPSHYEGLGCSLIEAMALSRAIVGSDASAIAEVLGHGEYGRVVPRHDEDALARALAELLDDHDRRVELGRRARARFLEQYELDTVADRMVALYDDLASVSGGGEDPL